ncbi:hypothetical protein CCR75_002604 [Bremia lactucae]|uniref:RRM domain-containing protein n=1 Tax=Bremia lactucae TaxID=4779 RepID=A0A976ILB2_BRELC|nr:hypothetical protein CCR75_002604 [Bremia lactucae]
MSDTSATLWESELLRARQWIAGNNKNKQHEHDRIYQCVKAHIGYNDHQRSLQSDMVVSDDEDHRALDFLGDLNAADISILLQAEAEVSLPRADVAVPVESHVQDRLIPLDMPPNLISPISKPFINPVPALRLESTVLRSSSINDSATLGSDSAVDALMSDLHVEITPVHYSDTEESKTEESTPPHVLKNVGGNTFAENHGISAEAGGQAGQIMHGLHVSSKSPLNPSMKKVASLDKTKIDKTKIDDAATEMLSWVSGYRDPDVIRRKENMRQKRKQPLRYGVSSEEEQLQIMLQVKKITRESDCDSDDDYGSDYTPLDDEEAFEPEEPEVVDLLSDDDIDRDKDKPSLDRNCHRLRQVKSTTKMKRLRIQKPAITRKLDQSVSINTSTYLPTSKLEGHAMNSTECSARGNILAQDKLSGNETIGDTIHECVNLERIQDCDESSKPKALVGLLTGSHSTDVITAESEATVSQLKASISLKEAKAKACSTVDAPEEASSATVAPNNASANILFQPQAKAAEWPHVGEASSISTGMMEMAMRSFSSDASTVTAYNRDTEADDAVVEVKQLPPVLEEDNDHCFSPIEVLGIGADAEQRNKEVMVSETVHDAIDDAQQIAEADEEDVSDAETEILDDDEPGADNHEHTCDDEVSGIYVNSAEKIATHGQNDFADSKEESRNLRGSSLPVKHCDSDAMGTLPSKGKNDCELVASRYGVQQFFDLTPLQTKPKIKTTSSRVLKPLPVHTNAESPACRDFEISTSEKTSSDPLKQKNGSNGLQSGKRPVATSTIMKGKYAATRRSTKMLDNGDNLGAKIRPNGLYRSGPPRIIDDDAAKDLDDIPLSILTKEMAKNVVDVPKVRYLSYAGAKKTESAPILAKEAPRIQVKSRFGGGGHTENSLTVLTKQQDKSGLESVFNREPQISIYDALHVETQEKSCDFREESGYKRSSRFKKMQEEAARKGIPIIKSRPKNTDWDKVPIPRKRKEALPLTSTPSQAIDQPVENAKNKRFTKNTPISSARSYYGPQGARLATPDSSSRRTHDKKLSKTGDFTRNEKLTARSEGRKFHDRRSERRRIESPRSKTRSSGARAQSYLSSSRHRRRSRERSSEKYLIRNESVSSERYDQDRQNHGSRQYNYSKFRDSKKKDRLPESSSNNTVEDKDESRKKQKMSHCAQPSSPGALATVDDVDDSFISNSEDEIDAPTKEVEDIRFDLNDILVDKTLMARQIYVTGVNPTVFAEQIEEDFARFGIAIDRETGFPAIDIYPCQRNHLGRGDACLTFETEMGALEAVEEMNSKKIKNSMIRVRQMDAHTQQILAMQFQMVRDTWKCTGSQCRADVSIWKAKCDKCGRTRVYGPSNINIGAESWLCSLCFTANESISSRCHGCMEALPEGDRSMYYKS